MTSDVAAEGVETRQRRWWQRRRWRSLIVLLVVFAVAISALWTQRRPIARGFVDRELAKRGVPARYTVDAIGLSSQRLTNVVIGDPRDPDLVADWIEVRTEVGFGGAKLAGIAVGHARARARLRADGSVSLGSIDKLLPPPSGKPFALPALDTAFEDVRIRIETPYGLAGVKLSGSGRLDDGFSGRLAATSERIAASGCTIGRVRGAFALRISSEMPSIEGPARIAAIDCGETHARGAAADVVATLGAALDRWTGRVRLAVDGVRRPEAVLSQLLGRATFSGSAKATAGDVSLRSAVVSLRQGRAEGAGIAGRYRIAPGNSGFNGRLRADRAMVSPALVARLAGSADAAAGTPVAPLVRAIVQAGAAAAQNFALDGAVEAVVQGSGAAVRLASLDATSTSGARIAIDGPLMRFGAVELGGRVAMSGGGLPMVRADLRQTADGLRGRAVIAPYTAGGARIALTPVEFAAGGAGITRIATVATLSGPLAGGRVEALRVPIEARWRGTRLVLGERCTPVAWQRIAVSGLDLASGGLTLCPDGPAMAILDRGLVAGGARLGQSHLVGRIGGTPLDLAVAGSRIRLADTGFVLDGIAARLGAPERRSRLDIGRLTGSVAGGGLAGTFADAAGQIGNVPLLLSKMAGRWSVRGGILDLAGGLTVADAQVESPRFVPLRSDDVALRLDGSMIEATGSLMQPAKRVRVADVKLAHNLSRGAGAAAIDVPGITFGDLLQPNDLTPITFGVIADVHGSVAGKARISWTPQGVSSTGTFGTKAMDLAAAFGPVTGLAGDIRFTDLLGLVSAPSQIATIATVNPGIAVENGTVRYQLVGNNRVQVEGGSWPFANGQLLLDPTLLDFSGERERRMTFRVAGADAAAFLQQFDFENLNATGVFDGVLPMIFDEKGGRIENGRLKARGGGNLAYVGTITEKDVGTWGNMAFQALKSLDYRDLAITMNGPLAGEMVTQINFAGISQGQGTKSNFIIRRLAKLPFVFNITVRAPFRQLLDSVRSYYDPSRLIERNLPVLLEERRRREQGLPPATQAIQPPSSETMP